MLAARQALPQIAPGPRSAKAPWCKSDQYGRAATGIEDPAQPLGQKGMRAANCRQRAIRPTRLSWNHAVWSAFHCCVGCRGGARRVPLGYPQRTGNRPPDCGGGSLAAVLASWVVALNAGVAALKWSADDDDDDDEAGPRTLEDDEPKGVVGGDANRSSDVLSNQIASMLTIVMP